MLSLLYTGSLHRWDLSLLQHKQTVVLCPIFSNFFSVSFILMPKWSNLGTIGSWFLKHIHTWLFTATVLYVDDYPVLANFTVYRFQVEGVTHGTDQFSDTDKATLLHWEFLTKNPLRRKNNLSFSSELKNSFVTSWSLRVRQKTQNSERNASYLSQRT